jgi:penicillin amidase
MEGATMNFNFFCVSRSGDIGYRFAGLVPVRAAGVDPRFPTPGAPEYAWQGFIPPAQMPHALNPSAGFMANWNNKPVGWWPNGDSPVWGPLFRNSAVLDTLGKRTLDIQDLEMTAWTIARTDENWPYLRPYLERAMAGFPEDRLEPISGFDGRLVDGSRQAATYLRFVSALRSELFAGTTGTFLSPDYFSLVIQPSVIWRALRGETKINFLAGRRLDAVLHTALEKALSGPATAYKAGGITVPGQTPIPYSDRGTYIQLIEALRDGMSGRNVVTPGVAETGPNSFNQVPLARAWLYKPMSRPWSPNPVFGVGARV